MLGAIGAGKSHVARRLAALAGAAVVDADREATRALEQCARDGRLASRFGPETVRADGMPDREAIARLVFDDDDALAALESLLHPPVLASIEEQVRLHRADAERALLVLDVPLLLERGLDTLCDALWFVDTPDALRFERAATRGLEADEIERRERRQLPPDRKRERADLVIRNDQELDSQLTRGLAALGLPITA